MFSWSFSNKKSRSSKWYITAIIGVLVFLTYWIVSWVYMMSIASLLFAGVFLLIENNSTPMTEIMVQKDWIYIDNNFYDWNDFYSFSILTIWNLRVIRFFSKNKIANIVDIPISPEIDHILLSEFISTIIPENKDSKVTTIDNIARIMQI